MVVLSVADHWIVLEATDSEGLVGRDSVLIVVQGPVAGIDRPLDPTDAAAGFVVGRVVVRYTDGVLPTAKIAEINAEYGLTAQGYMPDLGLYVATASADDAATVALAEALAADARVAEASVDALVYQAAIPPDFDPVTTTQAFHRMTGTDRHWARSSGPLPGAGTVIAVIELGVDLGRADFQATPIVAPAYVAGPIAPIQTGSQHIQDRGGGHGTLVASIALGGGTDGNGLLGIAPGAALMPVALGSAQPSVLAELTTLARGIRHARLNGADVINVSMAWPPTARNKQIAQSTSASGLALEMQQAIASGIPVVVAAGNCYTVMNDPVNCPQPVSQQEVNLLGTLNQAVWVVGAVDASGSARKSDSQVGAFLDLVASGENVCGDSPIGTGGCGNGTSFAAPVVSGLAALYRAAGIPIDQALRDHTIDLGPLGRDSETGHGRAIIGIGLDVVLPSWIAPGVTTHGVLFGRNFDPVADLRIDGLSIAGPTVSASSDTLAFQYPAPGGVDSVPVAVHHPRGSLVSDTLWLQVVKGIFLGSETSCALSTGGAVWCWGSSEDGQFGDGSTTGGNTPRRGGGGMAFQALDVAAPNEGEFTCGIATGGAAFCWGGNTFGQLGDGSTNDAHSPRAVVGGLRFVVIAAGGEHACGIVLSGLAYCWGRNEDGQLGDGSLTDRTTPGLVTGGHRFQSIDAGDGWTCGLDMNGGVWCWGDGDDGQLGNGGLVNQSVPTAVAGGRTYRWLTVGDDQACAIERATDLAFCWGDGGSGELGSGTVDRLVPTQVAGAIRFATVLTGDNHTCGVSVAGVGYCWGSGGDGQLGNGGTSSAATPQAVSGGLVWRWIAAGEEHSCGVTRAGTYYCWGYSRAGMVGDGVAVDATVTVPQPVTVP